jgi:GNAT superfamily N-acetyltransferase
MTEPHEFHELTGAELGPWIDPLGRLRIRVFREYPYLYAGTLEYERDYLRTYQQARQARVVIVTDAAGEVVAATTCVPLAEEGPEFQAPFLGSGPPVSQVLYLGESIALPAWRGRGLGKEFFARREAHARRLGLTVTAFCAVDRPADHPARPPGYRPLDGFWQSRGYVKQPGMQATFEWQEVGEAAASPKTLTFWLKSWTP